MQNFIFTTKEELHAAIEMSIRKLLEDSESTSQAKTILNVSEAASYLNLARQTIYGLTSKRLIPFMKTGKKLYFQKGDLDQWLLDGKQLTKAEIESKGITSIKGKRQ
jgi:excisionase family DNA binding protein